MIKLENVSFGYENLVFDNISLEIKSNDITFIVGKNGSGKSTLAHILSGLKKINKGNLIIDDEVISKKTSIKNFRKSVGIVFQNPDNQIIFNRVYDDIKFTLENMNTPKEEIDNIIKSALKEVGMEKFINSNPYNLSGGEKQRIAIASIIALNPKYIIFDEATSMLDIEGKKAIYAIIKKLKSKGIGVIFITNIIDELIYGDRVLILDNKKIYGYQKEELFNNLNILKEHKLDIPFNLKVINKLKIKNVNSEEDILKGFESYDL